MSKCPSEYLTLEVPGESKKCVKDCPAGYKNEAAQCVRCKVEKCPRGMFTLKNLMIF